MSAKGSIHRETLRAALRVIQNSETLDDARIQLSRMLNVFDKLENQGLSGDAAVKETEKRLATSALPKKSKPASEIPATAGSNAAKNPNALVDAAATVPLVPIVVSKNSSADERPIRRRGPS